MRCLLVNACQVACYICAWTTASCMAAGQDSVSYFPTKVGAKWVYDLNDRAGFSCTQTSVERQGLTIGAAMALSAPSPNHLKAAESSGKTDLLLQ